MKKYLKDIIAHPLFSGSAVMVFGSNFINIISYLYHFVMGKLLGPVGYGELVSLISIIGLLGIIPSSISLVIIKFVSSSRNEEEIVNFTSWLRNKISKVSIVFFIIIILLSPLINSFLHVSEISNLILIAISYLFSLPTLINRSILQGVLKFKEMILSIFAENIIKLILGVLLVFFGFGVRGAMFGFTVAIIVGWYFTYIFLRIPRKNNVSNSFKKKSMLLYTFPVMIQTLSITSLYSMDVILVKHFFSSGEAGVYAALSTLGKIILFGSGPIGAVMFPLVSQRHSRGEKHKSIFYYSFLATAFFSLVILIIYRLFPTFVITTLYNRSFLAAKDLLSWFGIFMMLFTLAALLINYCLSLGKTKVVIFPSLAALAQIVIIWFYHPSLFAVIITSNLITALLLVILLIYLNLNKEGVNGNKVSIFDSSSI